MKSFLSLTTLLLLARPAAAADASDAARDAFRFFAEEGRSSTALRRVAPTQGSPVPVDVVTAEDIRASGAVNLWDLLRFRVGLDVIEGRSLLGSNRAVVSVRGELTVSFRDCGRAAGQTARELLAGRASAKIVYPPSSLGSSGARSTVSAVSP